jgi:sigma-B regulation protein RsbU (phosphoserine phosphatase)
MTAAPDSFETEPRHWRARLAASVDAVRELSRSTDPQDAYAVFARRLNELFPVGRQMTVSRRGLRPPQYRVTRYSLWTDPADPWREPHRLPVHGGGLLADLVYGGQPRLVPDLQLTTDDPAAEYLGGQRSVLGIPLFDQGAAPNMLVLAREGPDGFPRDRIPDLVLLGNLFARATRTLASSRAVREAYDAVDYELQTVAGIQASLLPDRVPDVPGLDVAVHYRAAGRAGGDYYDFFPLPGGRLGVLVADASGHGAPAAVLMAIAHSVAHTRPDPPARPGELLTHLNHHLTRRYTRQTGNFMTAFYAVFDPAAGTLAYASAGHNPPRVARADGTRAVLNRAQRLPLGINPDEVYPEQAVPLRPGDRVALFTDGVIEAVGPGGDVFGPDRLDAALPAGPGSADAAVRAVLRDLSAFTADAPPGDDRTVVVVGRT